MSAADSNVARMQPTIRYNALSLSTPILLLSVRRSKFRRITCLAQSVTMLQRAVTPVAPSKLTGLRFPDRASAGSTDYRYRCAFARTAKPGKSLSAIDPRGADSGTPPERLGRNSKHPSRDNLR